MENTDFLEGEEGQWAVGLPILGRAQHLQDWPHPALNLFSYNHQISYNIEKKT